MASKTHVTGICNECRLLKPSREIYEHVLRSEGIRPENLLFIDDSERNTEAAAALGIRTLQVETNSDWTSAMDIYIV